MKQNWRYRSALRHVFLDLIAVLAFGLPLAAGADPGVLIDGVPAKTTTTLQADIDALSDSPTTHFIQLRGDVSVTDGLRITNKTVIFKLDGHSLAISNKAGPGLTLTDSKVSYWGAGSLTVASTDDAVRIVATSDNLAVWEGEQAAIFSRDGTTAIVNGNVTVLAGKTGGISAINSKVTMNGNISVVNGYGVLAEGEQTEVTITGNVSAKGAGGRGIQATRGSHVTVNGSIATANGLAISTSLGVKITVNGDITANDGMAIYAGGNETKVTVNGPVNAKITTITHSTFRSETGVIVATDKAAVEIKNDVTVTTVDSMYAGVAVGTSGTVTIDGTLTATPFINVCNVIKTIADDTTPSTKAGYKTYLGRDCFLGRIFGPPLRPEELDAFNRHLAANRGDSVVWLKNAP
jgi:hypothetical protein